MHKHGWSTNSPPNKPPRHRRWRSNGAISAGTRRQPHASTAPHHRTCQQQSKGRRKPKKGKICKKPFFPPWARVCSITEENGAAKLFKNKFPCQGHCVIQLPLRSRLRRDLVRRCFFFSRGRSSLPLRSVGRDGMEPAWLPPGFLMIC